MFSSLFGQVELVNEQTIALGEIKRIAISYISEPLTLRVVDGDSVILREYFNKNDPYVFADIQNDGETLSIRHGERMLQFTLRGNIEVLIPRAFFGALNVKTISGRIDIPDRLALDALSVASTSGKLALANVAAGTATLSSISGSIEVGTLQAEAEAHTTSGSIGIANAVGDGDFKTVSGAIDIAYQSVTGDITLETVSGRLRLGMPPLLSYKINAQTISGGIHVPLGGSRQIGGGHSVKGTVGDAPQVTVRMKSVSGRVEIYAMS